MKTKDSKISILLTIILSHFNIKLASKYFYKKRTGKKLDLNNPKNFNEKLMWLKLNCYNNDEKIWKLADKYEVRKYLLNKGVKEDNLPQILYKYESAYDIKYDELPEKFALKCTHGCGFNIICDNKSKFDLKKAQKKLNKWLKTKFGYRTAELHYTHQKPIIVCEKYIEGNNNGFPWDYKIYCFNGKPKVILVCTDRKSGYKTHFYDNNWNKLNLRNDQSNENVEKPKSFNKMLEICEKIAMEFPFVRIDFYEQDEKPIIGELTFTPSSCTAIYNDYGDRYLSKLLDISELVGENNEK